MTLLLLSLMRRLRADGLDEPVSAEQIGDSYLRNRYGKEDLSYKMLLTKTDKDTLIVLLEGKTPQEPVSSRIIDNFEFFTEQMATADVVTVYQGIQKLMIFDVRLQQGLDNPQMIFESMNSTGKALTQADLIRNFVIMGLQHDLQTFSFGSGQPSDRQYLEWLYALWKHYRRLLDCHGTYRWFHRLQ